MIFPERTTNLVRGKGFHDNDYVLLQFVDAGKYQEALDYFGFEGRYVEDDNDVSSFDPKTGTIRYRSLSFISYSELMYSYLKELFHKNRYGDPENGLFVAPEGTPFDARSLPYAYKNKSYNVYEVIKPISGVQSGTTAPSFWFNTQGGGTQYLLPYDVKYLLQNGYIKPIF